MEDSLQRIYREALTYRDTTPHNSRRKLKAYNDKLTYYMNWLEQVETEMAKAGYTMEEISGILKRVRKQYEREKTLAKNS